MNTMTMQLRYFQFQLIMAAILKNRFFILLLIGALAFLLCDTAIAAVEDGAACADGDDACEAAAAAAADADDSTNPFAPFYNFVYDAATGYLGRGIALTGGIIGLGFGAASGKALPAVVGIVLAMFGALGPRIINALFAGALI